MARLFTWGFETKDDTLESGGTFSNFGTAPTYDTGTVRTGSVALKASSGAGNTTSYHSARSLGLVTARDYYLRFYFRVPTLPSSNTRIGGFGASTSIDIFLFTNGTVQAGNSNVTEGSPSVTVVAPDTWYRVQQHVRVNTGASDDTYELMIGDEVVYSTTTENIGTTAVSDADFGWKTAPGANRDAYYDDVALNDSTGQAQTSWPGDGNAYLLVPISDSARATLWTGGAGGTTNLWDAVNNTPPTGLASASATNTSQIEHAGGAAGTTDAYDANMTTPATAGIPATDIARTANFIEADGEDIATGTKLLNFEVVSNPVLVSPGNVTAGNDGGAVGTYPTTWAVRPNQAMAHNLALANGTSPVMRARRPETATRVASVAFMGIYIESGPEIVSNLYNTFEGGTNTTTISAANSGGISGDAFDAVTISATAGVTFDNTHTLQGSALAAKVSTGGTAGNADLDWTTSLVTVGTTLYARLYLYATANPGTSHRIWVAAPSSGTHCISQMTTTGKLNILTSTGGAIATSTNSIALNQWVRVEYSTVATPTGTVTAKLYNNADSTVATETLSGANSGGTNQIVKSVFGISGTAVANVGPIWMDGLATGNNGDFFGPIRLPDVAMAPYRAA